MHPVLRIGAIAVVFVLAAVAWVALGGVTSMRSSDQRSSLSSSVVELFGGAQEQAAPRFVREWTEIVTEVEDVRDARGEVSRVSRPREVLRSEVVPPTATDIDVTMHLDERRKGLLWFPLYDVRFGGAWTWRHDGTLPRTLRIGFQFPDASGQYDDFTFVVDGEDVARTLTPVPGGVEYVRVVQPGEEVRLAIGYRSRGMDRWSYRPADGVGQIEAFRLALHTDFSAIDYPAGTLSPTTRTSRPDGWDLEWTYARMVTGKGVGMVVPTRIQPGELATSLALSAPIPLGLFFVWIFVLSMLRGIDIHPVNYLFIAAAFVSFNLLFSYTADRLPVEAAFGVASAVSVLLVASYLRLVVGPRFALLEAGLAQVAYQVGFGVAHFFEGFTGLTITLLGIATLFALMQLTGRIQWSQVLASPRAAPPRPVAPQP